MNYRNKGPYLFFLTVVALSTQLTEAAPRMDSVVGTGKPLMATVLPDNQDPNLFYVFPQKSNVAVKDDGKQDFLYIENRHYGWGKYQVLSARLGIGIVPNINSSELDAKVAEIKATNPNAKFAVISPFQTSVLAQVNEKDSYFERVHCPEISGPLEVPVFCDIQVNPVLAKGFRKVMGSTNTQVLQLEYKFYGVVGGVTKEYAFTIPLRVGSITADGYFFDQNGDPIK